MQGSLSPKINSPALNLRCTTRAVRKANSGSLRLEGAAPYKELGKIRALAPDLCQGASISDALAPAGGASASEIAAPGERLGARARICPISLYGAAPSSLSEPGLNLAEKTKGDTGCGAASSSTVLAPEGGEAAATRSFP